VKEAMDCEALCRPVATPCVSSFRPSRRWWCFGLLLALVLTSVATLAADVERGVLVREAAVYLSPDARSQRLGAPLERGNELAILEKSSGGWIHIEPMTKSVTGWILDKGLVRASTANGDQILYGAAVNAEGEASRRRGARGELAAKEAYHLYRLTTEYFPNSPLAGEAFYRSADVRWQLERQEIMSRPSAKQADPYMRGQIDEEAMRQVLKKYPRTKWADLAAYNLIDNKLCGNWQGEVKCPEKEAGIYEKYAEEHPQSPVAAEALYNAATRRAALIDMFKAQNEEKRSAEAKARTLVLTQRVTSQYPQQGDWASRARALEFLVGQDIPTYGNATPEAPNRTGESTQGPSTQ
jgi:hypothetical protein